MTYKPARPNIDDTDTEEETDDDQAATIPANAGMDEWKTYLNTIDVIPAGMTIVQWWGGCDPDFCACVTSLMFVCCR